MEQNQMCDQCQTPCVDKILRDKFNNYRSAICDLLDKLGLKQKDAIIGGSMALYCQDMPVEDIHDVDLDIQHKEGLIPALELLAAAAPSPELHNYAGDRDPNHYTRVDFFFKGIKFNVWLVPNLDNRPYMWKDYMKYASIMSVLKYKFGYARNKDIEYYLNLDSIFKSWLLLKKS